MERIGDQGGLRRHHLEHPAVGTGEIERAVLDPIAEGRSLLGQPPHRMGAASTRDDVEQLATADVDDLGGVLLAAVGPDPDHQHLVEPKRADLADAFGVGIEEGFAVGDDGVVHGVPVTAELAGHLVHAPGTTTDLDGRPPGGPGGEHLAGAGDAVLLFGPRPPGAVGISAHPAALVPDEANGSSEHRKVHQLHSGAVLHVGDHAAPRTTNRRHLRLEVDAGRAVGAVLATEERHRRKSDHPLESRA